eukprot:15211986-Alexandrium_andersonii.AAC.1
MASAAKTKAILSPTDPLANRPAAGVGILACVQAHAVEIMPRCEEMGAMRSAGRAACYQVDMFIGTPVRVFVIYGWTDSATRPQARQDTSRMIRAVLEESEMFPGPFLVAGDLNAEVADICCLRDAVSDGYLFDLTAMQAFTGQPEVLGTCKAHGSSKITRRDMILASAPMLRHVRDVSVVHGEGFDVHSPVQMR